MMSRFEFEMPEILASLARIQKAGHGELVIKVVDNKVMQLEEMIRHRKPVITN